jgi:hypothetical protein
MEAFYYDAIYNILKEETIQDTTAQKLKELKARIVRLHHIEQRRFIDIDEQDRQSGEQPSIYHIVKSRKRQEGRTVHCIHDDGNPQTNNINII